MFKLRKVSFSNHPILGNLALDFCDAQGNAVDTVLIAGENGVGKSTLLDMLYLITSGQIDFPVRLELEDDSSDPVSIIRPCIEKHGTFWQTSVEGQYVSGGNVTSALKSGTLSSIFSDVSINFTTNGRGVSKDVSPERKKGCKRESDMVLYILRSIAIAYAKEVKQQ